MRKTQPSIWESVEIYRRIVESARDFAIITVDLKNRVTFWNRGAERILGYREREAIGMSGADIFTPEDRKRGAVAKELAGARRNGRAEDERWHVRKDGTRFWGSGLMMPLRNDGKRFFGFVKILRDLTQRKAAQDELIDLNRTLEDRVQRRTRELEDSHLQLGELARQLTRTERMERERIAADLHDNLGQLLAFAQMKIAAISGCVAAPEEVIESAHEVREYLDEAVTYTRALMSNLSPPGIGRGDLLQSLKWLVADLAKHGMKVSLTDDRKRKVISPDAQAAVFQAVRELLYNVRKHAGVDRALVRTSRQGEKLRIEVVDQGVGFGKSRRTDDSKSGFGLFHVSERVKLFGGKIEIDRKRKGGTRAIVTMPIQAK